MKQWHLDPFERVSHQSKPLSRAECEQSASFEATELESWAWSYVLHINLTQGSIYHESDIQEQIQVQLVCMQYPYRYLLHWSPLATDERVQANHTDGFEEEQGEYLIDEPILTKPVATYKARVRIQGIHRAKPARPIGDDIEIDFLDG